MNLVWPKQGLLLVGEEGPGFSASEFPTRIRIPTTGVESLNVVVAASIALFSNTAACCQNLTGGDLDV